MNLLMCLAHSLEDFILGLFGFMHYAWGEKEHCAWGVQGCSCRTLVNPGTQGGRLTLILPP